MKICLQSCVLSIILLSVPLISAAETPVIFETPLSPRIANYEIEVALDTSDRTIQAHEVMTWHNKSDDIIGEIQFHLYLNGFRNNQVTFLKESGGTIREISFDQDSGWGFIDVTRMAMKSGEDLTGRMEFIQPDNDHADDKTVLRLPLPSPLQPGDSVALEIDYIAKLPTPPIRTGAKKEYFFVGQWFPKAGVYIDGKWNCHQFHSNAEFFADFGVYDVRITVPKENIVGATGIEVDVTDNNDGTATHYYHAEDVHDFAWTTSPEFIEFTADTQDVAIRVLMQPDHVCYAERYLAAAKAAVAYMQDWIGDYPFPNLTVVDPRRGALNSGGMEYPTLITSVALYGLPDGLRLSDGTVIHEFIHNYWYHMLATNEFEESWMDEGFTSYSEAKILNKLYGPDGDMLDLLGIKLNQQTLSRIGYMTYPDRDPMLRAAWEFYSVNSYVVNSYDKSATMLFTLENYVGEETMTNILRAYYDQWRFKHPRTRDFINIANEVSGQDLNWFFDQAIYSGAVLDYSVSWISSKKVDSAKGYDFTLTVFDEDRVDDSAASDSVDNGDNSEDETIYYSEVKIRRIGTFVFPVEIEIEFDDGEIRQETWDGRDNWTMFTYTGPAKVVSATVDPDRKVTLDVNYANNSRTLDFEGLGVAKWSTRVMFWAQFIMDQPEFANLLSILEGFSIE